MFLKRAVVTTIILGIITVSLVLLGARHVTWLVFGQSGRSTLLILTAVCLGAVILYHLTDSLLTSLRMYRVASGMQFFQSLTFAAIVVTLLLTWRLSAESVIIAFAAASLLTAVIAWMWIGWAVQDIPDTRFAAPHSAFWPKLMRFAIWIWITNLLANLFASVDRYMILHCGGMDNATAMAVVGHYRCSRIVPVLIVSVADLLGSVMTPHLSQDWEAGRKLEVSKRLNFVIKVLALASMAAAVGVLLFAPLMFDVLFQGKYDGGRTVLPWTLTYCIWFGMLGVAQNYLWCAEKARLGSLAFLAGLVANICLNLVLLPWYGLWGAVVATTAGNFIALVLTYVFSRQMGMQIHLGTWILSIGPVLLGFGLVPAVAALCAAVLLILSNDRLFDRDEKQQLIDIGRDYLGRARHVFVRGTESPTCP